MTDPIDHDDGIAIDAILRTDEEAPRAGMHVKLSLGDVLNCTDETNTLYVFGSAGDSVEAGGGWTVAGRETLEGAVFNIYTQDGVTLKVECDIDQSLIGLV
jgi:hypothetical protein